MSGFGGVVAIFYALGYTPDQIEEMFSALDQSQMYGYSAEAGPSLLGLAGVTTWFKEIIGEKTFADLKIPCVVTAADLQCGCEVILSQGSLIEALLATIAIPEYGRTYCEEFGTYCTADDLRAPPAARRPCQQSLWAQVGLDEFVQYGMLFRL